MDIETIPSYEVASNVAVFVSMHLKMWALR